MLAQLSSANMNTSAARAQAQQQGQGGRSNSAGEGKWVEMGGNGNGNGSTGGTRGSQPQREREREREREGQSHPKSAPSSTSRTGGTSATNRVGKSLVNRLRTQAAAYTGTDRPPGGANVVKRGPRAQSGGAGGIGSGGGKKAASFDDRAANAGGFDTKVSPES